MTRLRCRWRQHGTKSGNPSEWKFISRNLYGRHGDYQKIQRNIPVKQRQKHYRNAKVDRVVGCKSLQISARADTGASRTRGRLGNRLPSFAILNHDGHTHELSQRRGKTFHDEKIAIALLAVRTLKHSAQHVVCDSGIE